MTTPARRNSSRGLLTDRREWSPFWRQRVPALAPVAGPDQHFGGVLAGDPSIQSVDDLARSRSRSLAVSSSARFESVETDALVWSLAYDR